MDTAIRFDRKLKVMFGDQEIEIGPLKGLKAYGEFESLILEEIADFRRRVEEGVSSPSDPAGLLTQAVNVPKLLIAACPHITEEMVENSTPSERLGVLCETLRMNHLGHLALFLEPSTLLDLGLRLRDYSTQILEKEFGGLTSGTDSSEVA
jgi:hypothetical protein